MRLLAQALGAASLAALASAAGRPAVAQSPVAPLASTTPPRFAASMAQELSASGRSTLRVTLQVPYPEIQFVRVPAGYGAAVELLLVVRDGKDRQVGGDAWEERFVVATFPETQAAGALLTASRTLAVEPGKYRVKARVRDANSRRQSEVEGEVEVRGVGPEGLAVATPSFGECAPESTGALRFRENASRRFVSSLDRFCVRFGIYDRAPEPKSYRVLWRILDDRGDAVREGGSTVARTDSGTALLRPEASGLFLGAYRLDLRVQEGRREARTQAEFYVETLDAPQGEDWNILVEALALFAGEPAVEPLRRAETVAERDRVWREFWLARDPDPHTPANEVLVEFVRRLRYANANFRGLSLGYKTDQGRIYMRYGAPDYVEDRPASDRSPPIQIWEYQEERKRFVFVDRQSFGRYELLSSEDL